MNKFVVLLFTVLIGFSANSQADGVLKSCLGLLKNLVPKNQSKQAFINFPSTLHKQEIPKNSYSAQINIIPDIEGKRITLPQVYKINEIWGLTPESNIYFVEQSGVKRVSQENKKGEIDKLDFHTLISRGKIGVSSPKSSEEIFKEDIIYHVVGFYIISKTPTWKTIQNLMRDFLRYRNLKEANELREKLAMYIEIYSATLSMMDQNVETTFITQDNVLDSLSSDVRKIQSRWISIISSVGIY